MSKRKRPHGDGGDERLILGKDGYVSSRVVLTPEQIDQLSLLAGFGNSMEEAAQVLGISVYALRSRLVDTPAVAQAWYAGRSKLKHECHKHVYNGMVRGDTRLTVFAAKNWAGMQDVKQVEIGATKGPPSSETVRQRMAELMGEDPRDPSAGLEPGETEDDDRDGED